MCIRDSLWWQRGRSLQSTIVRLSLGDAARHLTYRPYFHAYPASSWVAGSPPAAAGDLSKSTAPPYSFQPAAWMSPDASAAAAAAGSAMSRTWGAMGGGLQHHQQQSLHHHHHHHHHQNQHQHQPPHLQTHQQNMLHQPTSHQSALFQPMVRYTFTACF